MMNKLFTIFVSVLVISLSPISTIAQSNYDQLSLLYSKSFQNNDSLKYRKEFFKVFPNTFSEFRSTYNKPENPLYSQSTNHLKLFASLDIIDDTTYMNKLINLSIGGFHDADAVTRLKMLISNKIFQNPQLLGYLLQKRTTAEIRSFFYFFFDGIIVRYNSPPTMLKPLKKNYPFTYILMESTLANVISDREYINNKLHEE